MPTALTTTKRKFHKILDSISNGSSVSLATGKYNASTTTLPASTDPPAKKPRMARPASARLPATKLDSVAPIKGVQPPSSAQKTASASMSEERKTPNFAPWDRTQFLGRLKTYRQVDKWRSKPDKINEVEWSKRGWSCVGRERVGCVGGCAKEIVITLETSREDKEVMDEKEPEQGEDEEDEDDWREKARLQLVDKYAEMITTGHDGGCLWRRRGCDDTIQRLSLAHQATAINDLRQRYLSLVAMSSELPPHPSTPESFDTSDIREQIIPLLHPPIPTESQSEAVQSTSSPENPRVSPNLDSSAMLLALFGWQAEEGHIPGLATCTACFRRLGLWLFKASPDSSTPSAMDRLDLVGEHRDYCPWINPLSQNGAASRRTSLEGLAGWQVLIRAVRASSLHNKYDNEQVPAAMSKDVADEAVSDISSPKSLTSSKEDRKEQDERDNQRWAKLKKLKQAFHVKRGKGGY